MLTRSQAERIYKDLIINLRGEIEAHVNPAKYQLLRGIEAKPEGNSTLDYQAGVAAFCRAYGISRPNLVSCLTEQRTLSVGLFQRIAIALGQLAADKQNDDAVLQNLSLVTFLMIDGNAIKDAILLLS